MESSFGSQPSKSNDQKFNSAPKSHLSHSHSHSQNDRKGKGKLFPKNEKKTMFKPKVENRESANVKFTNPKNEPKVLKSNKIKVFTIKRKDETTLIKRTFLVDVSLTIPYTIKGSQGPKKFWVPKST